MSSILNKILREIVPSFSLGQLEITSPLLSKYLKHQEHYWKVNFTDFIKF